MASFRLVTPYGLCIEWAKIFNGCYHISGPRPIKLVCDVGANIGAFSLYAQVTWPDCKVIAYEPVRHLAEMFIRNVPRGAELHNVAVTDSHGHAPLVRVQDGDSVWHNTTHSVTAGVGDVVSSVPTIPGRDLPDCDLLKVDTEGSEVAILSSFLPAKAESGSLPAYVVLEYHSASDLGTLIQLLQDHEYCIAAVDGLTRDVGLLKAYLP